MATIQHEISSGAGETPLKQLNDFSLMSGGPLYQLWRRTRLSGDDLEFTRRRVIVMVLITWLPLAAVVDYRRERLGRQWGGYVPSGH